MVDWSVARLCLLCYVTVQVWKEMKQKGHTCAQTPAPRNKITANYMTNEQPPSQGIKSWLPFPACVLFVLIRRYLLSRR